MGMNVSDTLAGTFKLKAGSTIDINDAIEIGPDGNGYPVVCTDYAAVTNFSDTAQTSTATGRIIAQTSVGTAMSSEFYGKSVAIDSFGNILVAQYDASNYPTIYKFTSAGTLLRGPVVIESAAATWRQMAILSNGNIAVVYRQANKLQYIVYDQYLVVVKAVTTIDAGIQSSSVSGVTALSGGGFAVVYQISGSANSTLVTYDNTGTAVLAATTIWTRAGTVGYQLHRMEQLSSGNLVVISASSNSTGDIGLFHGVVTTAGVSVAAFANEDTAVLDNVPQVSVMTGYFCVAASGQSGTHAKARIYSNAGVIQGAAFSGLCSYATMTRTNAIKITNDGANFWLFWSNTTSGYATVTKLPITGTGYTSSELGSAATIYGSNMDGFIEGGRFVVIAQQNPSSASNALIWVISCSSLSLLNAGTVIGTASTSSYYFPQLIPGGDFSFIALYDNSVMRLTAGKFANTAIVGVAAAPAAVNDYANIHQAAGTYRANTLKGSPAVAFDHTTGANITGNKGTILNDGLVLRGM